LFPEKNLLPLQTSLPAHLASPNSAGITVNQGLSRNKLAGAVTV
jgi:hypothetical protein